MSKLIDVRELTDRLEEVLASAAAGDDVILTDGNIPRARLLPLSSHRPRIAGLHAGALQTSPDFDAPLPDDFWAGRP
jgi:antitoxin (DNA-binding transcriptional repressor) of toxin-antitoxin stability system